MSAALGQDGSESAAGAADHADPATPETPPPAEPATATESDTASDTTSDTSPEAAPAPEASSARAEAAPAPGTVAAVTIEAALAAWQAGVALPDDGPLPPPGSAAGTSPPPVAASAPADRDEALLARVLLAHAVAAFKVVPDDARGPALTALDRFIAAPGPSLFLAAIRELREARRRVLIERHAGGALRRALAQGIEELRAVRAIPSAVADRLATDLPLDARTGQRLVALVALARSYEELAGRVAADTEEMRRRYQAAPPRRRRPRGRT
jgi:hypothetical protein